MHTYKKTLVLLLGCFCLSTALSGQSTFKWGIYSQFDQGNISEIYEWRNFLCFEGCSSVGHKAAFSYQLGLAAQYLVSEKTRVELKLGYNAFNYIEEETWSDGAGFFVRDTKRNLQHLSVGVGLQYRLLSLGKGSRHLYASGGVEALWNTQQEVDFGNINYAGTIGEWNSLGEIGLGVAWSIGKIELQTGAHISLALNNFARPLDETVRETDFDQLRPQTLGLKILVLFP